MNNVVFDRETDQVIAINREVRLYEYEVKLPYPINLAKTISEKTGEQTQKTDSDGNLLYKSNVIIDEFGNETYEETIESYIYNQDNEGEELELVQLEPVMIDEFVDKNYGFADNCSVFTYEEVLEGKIESINNNSLTRLFFYDEDFDSKEEIILSHCSTGDGVIIVYSGGSLSTQIINLQNDKNIIELYIESQKGLLFEVNDVVATSGKVKLSALTNKIIIKVSNPTNRNLELYAIGGLC